MKKVGLSVLIFVLAIARLWAQPGYLGESDHDSYLGKNRASTDLLKTKLSSVEGSAERAQIYWRLARDIYQIAELKATTSGPARRYLDLYEQSERYADQAITLDPSNARGYYWKAACVGRIAQIRNLVRAFLSAPTVRNLLFKAARLEPTDGEIWYVLAQLYSLIPGSPISFGNAVYAVSLGRKGLRTREAQVAMGGEPDVPADYYIQLARELAKRNWSLSQRQARQLEEAKDYRGASDVVRKNFYYEGVVNIPKMSDREEAISLDRRVVARLEAVPERSPGQNHDLRTARTDLSHWTR